MNFDYITDDDALWEAIQALQERLNTHLANNPPTPLMMATAFALCSLIVAFDEESDTNFSTSPQGA